jgi:iron complex outermembrane receptor protein
MLIGLYQGLDFWRCVMKRSYPLLIPALLLMLAPSAYAQTAVEMTGVLETVIVTATSRAPTSLPTQIPTTMEGSTKEKIATTINATDSEDALKYFPSLLVRKRYIGDYNHAVLSSRASGTGNSARSAVYADGILLSNYLGNGASYAPRWMLVTPEQIERVDVMYGPFSAAYPGNSVGAVVDFVTRMPDKFAAHAKVSYQVQPYRLYNTDETYQGHQESVSVGDRAGSFSWLLDISHLNSQGHPMIFQNKLLSAGTVNSLGTPVTGAVAGVDRSNAPWYLLGGGVTYTTIQDHAKVKFAYDITPTLRASYLFGYWQNHSEGRAQTYLRDASNNPVYSGTINIDGRAFTIGATEFGLTNEELVHLMHGASLKSNTLGVFDWELAASLFDYTKDEQRTATIAIPAALAGGAGALIDMSGTGWYNLSFKGVWRPGGKSSSHVVDFGYQLDDYQLKILRANIAGNWITDPAGSLNTHVGGKAQIQSVYAQDAWQFAPQWKAVLGARVEQWYAFDGFTQTTAKLEKYASRRNTFVSPKLAVAFEANESLALKASLGRAVRMPTVNELYGATTVANTQFINDPDLKPEQSWTAELTAEQNLGFATMRATGFYEVVSDSLFTDRRSVGSVTVNRVVNVGKVATPGVELAMSGSDVLIRDLDISGSVTWANSRIKENNGYVNASNVLSDDTIGRYQPRVPVWRATALLDYRVTTDLNIAYGLRYSGKQYSTLENSDVNGFAYQGASKYFVTDMRMRYQFAKQWSAAVGVDNLNNYKYWNFHPYPQRSYTAELKWDLR